MTRPLVSQPDRRPTRKLNAGAFGAALGSIVGKVAADLATRGGLWELLALPDVQVLLITLGAFAGTYAAGYFVRDRANTGPA